MNSDEKKQPNSLSGFEGLAFYGAITASVSHELNNVVSIIDQSAGLLDDLLYGASQGQPITEEQLQRVSEKISRQTARGIEIIKRLNKFAHSSDYPVTDFDLNDLMENFISLIERLAKIKGVELLPRYCEDPVNLSGNPFLTQQASFGIFKQLLTGSQKGDQIKIVISKDDQNAILEFIGQNHGTDILNGLNYVISLISGSNWTTDIKAANEKINLKLYIPGLK